MLSGNFNIFGIKNKDLKGNFDWIHKIAEMKQKNDDLLIIIKNLE